MEPDFWIERWARGDTPWQMDRVNPLLQQFLPRLKLPPGRRVFVPLCGGTLDLPWLRGQGLDAVGIDLAEESLRALIEQESLRMERRPVGGMTCYQGDGLTLWAGDFFNLTMDLLGPVDAIWDRAALVALPPVMRVDYARHMLEITGKKSRPPMLCWTLEYDQTLMDGPPFAVGLDELEQLWGHAYRIETLLARDILDRSPAFAEAGLTALGERVTLLS